MASARDYGLTVQGMSAGEELILCPFHNDSSASAWFNPKQELFYCAVCGYGLNGAQLAERLHLAEKPDSEFSEEPEDYDLLSAAPDFEIGTITDRHPYLRGRSIEKGIAGKYMVGYSEASDSICLPITDLKKGIVGVQHRYLHPEVSGTRYKTFGKVTPIWPMNLLSELRGGHPLIVTEGAFSAMRLASFFLQEWRYFTPVFATLGAKANQDIIDVVRGYEFSVFLYDNDKAGRTACAKMRKLNPMSFSWVLSKSPDDCCNEELRDMMLKVNRVLIGSSRKVEL